MRKSHIALLMFVAFTVGIAVRDIGPDLISEARADKTVTYLSAGVVMDSMTFGNAGGGSVSAIVCAHAKLQGGGDGPGICESITLPSTDPTSVDVTALAVNRGLPFWKTRQGL